MCNVSCEKPDYFCCRAKEKTPPHAVCSECLSGWCTASCDSDRRATLAANDGHIICSHPECAEPYDVNVLRSGLTPAAFQAWDTARTERTAAAAYADAWAHADARVAAAEAAAAAASAGTRVEAARKKVLGVLTLQCPSCQLAFVDFDACCAVSCHCGEIFCAFCLEGFGTGEEASQIAHSHVPACRRNPSGSLFCAEDQWQAAQRVRRKRLVLAELARLPAPLQAPVLDSVKTELQDLGIVIEGAHLDVVDLSGD